MTEAASPASAPPPSYRQLFIGMLQVALSAFGGGLSAWSQRIVVEQHRWLTNEQFLTGLTVARLFPGPNQINMAVYIGAHFHGIRGAMAALAGMLIVPFSLLMGFGVLYFSVHQLPAVDRVLAGVVAAAAGMALSMGFKILDQYWKDPVALLLAAATFVAMQFFHVRLVPLVLIAGPLAMAWYWPRRGQAMPAAEEKP
ncbi:chromate transporter [Synechococcus sp. CBW1004]|jgi:chromate transporter|uniref:chromate transporter n=1 Tax=Synechococcus sp. CBW1004 TaxID=1353136 RepID=UPI0018CCDB96|nr:chromate transporter [Synechococcus sp. CBW1004]QPN63061.1 chromate transporter [Synechococcus sp. CBW1004]